MTKSKETIDKIEEAKTPGLKTVKKQYKKVYRILQLIANGEDGASVEKLFSKLKITSKVEELFEAIENKFQSAEDDKLLMYIEGNKPDKHIDKLFKNMKNWR